MALTGVHVECGVIVKFSRESSLFYGVWSETIALGGTTTRTAFADTSFGDATTDIIVFRVRPSAEAYVAEGDAPDASVAISTNKNNNRAHLTAGELRDIPTTRGSKLTCLAVS